jgi:hypothetical protein
MGIFQSRKTTLPSRDEALPGRVDALRVPVRHFVNGNRIVSPFAANLEQALFGLGCFWGAERRFWQTDGVYSTAVGYSGGYTPNPTYEEVCSGRTGHAEVVRVIFDPARTSYDELLRVFWESHDPTQGMRQGTTGLRGALEGGVSGGTAPGGAGRYHNRSGFGARVLLRRGVSPAVSGEESERVLRHWGLRSSLQTRGVTSGGEGIRVG